ncbi:MAG: hypothetical protein U5R14_15715 [Gemmatimonadota bacterium]|nr:hypothetical protein [Gemmatimonadota bacterium]
MADAQAFMLTALGGLWVEGVEPDWDTFDEGFANRRVPLPGYPFEREPYFIDAPVSEERPGADVDTEDAAPGSDREDDVSRWFHRRSWKKVSPASARDMARERVLLLADDGGRARPSVPSSKPVAVRWSACERAETFRELEEGQGYALSPGALQDWKELARALHGAGAMPSVVVHAWCFGDTDPMQSADDLEARAFYAPLRLLQAFEDVTAGHEDGGRGRGKHRRAVARIASRARARRSP